MFSILLSIIIYIYFLVNPPGHMIMLLIIIYILKNLNKNDHYINLNISISIVLYSFLMFQTFFWYIPSIWITYLAIL